MNHGFRNIADIELNGLDIEMAETDYYIELIIGMLQLY